MGDSLKKVKGGDPLVIPAPTWNTILDATRDYLQRQQEAKQSPSRSTQDAAIVLAKNASGSDVGQFGVLGIDGPLFTPAGNLEAFKRAVVLSCVTPVAGHAGAFVVFQEPVAAGQLGRAVVSGATIVKVNVSDADHGFADVAAGQAGYLASGESGAARILWKESGTGEKWALAKLANAPGEESAAVPVKLSASNGSGSYTAKEQAWNGSAWVDKQGAENITVYNLFETTGSGMSAVDITTNPVVLVVAHGDRWWFERETNALYKA